MTESVRSGNGWCMACPKCGDHEQLDVEAWVNVRLMPDMETSAEDAADQSHEWDDTYAVTCGACGHRNDVAHFKRTHQDNDK